MTQGEIDAVTAIVFTLAVGYGLGLAFVTLIIIVSQKNK